MYFLSTREFACNIFDERLDLYGNGLHTMRETVGLAVP